ncbi:MAG: PAS domain S-box protein [Rhodospirillales bacterium]
MPAPLTVLIIDAHRPAAERMVQVLRTEWPGLIWDRVETLEELSARLRGETWDVLLCAADIQGLDGEVVLDGRPRAGAPPLIVVAEALPVERAAALMRAGAADLVDALTLAGLTAAVGRALDRAPAAATTGRRTAHGGGSAERHRHGDALRDSEARVRAIADSLPSQIAYVDRDQRYRFNNRAYEDWFGLSREDCYGRLVKDVLGDENYRAVGAHVERALAGERVQYEYLSRHGNRERYADVTYIPDIGTDGTVHGFYALVNDVTERKRVEQSLRVLHTVAASQELSFGDKLAALLRCGCEQLNLPIGIVSKIEGDRYAVVAASTPDGSIRPGDAFDLGNTYCRETVAAGDVIGFEHASASAWKTHPCHREMRLESYIGTPVIVGEAVYGTLNFSSFRPRETHFTATDREILRLMAQWIGGDIARLQTEETLRDQEKRIRDITDALPSQIAYVDRDQIYRFNNKAYEDWYGIPASACRGRHVSEVLGSNYERVRPHIDRALQGERVRFEYVGHYADGDRYAEVSYVPDLGDHGAVRGFYGLVHDITERRRTEAALRASETNFRIIAETIRDVFWISTPGMERMIYVSPAYEEIWGLSCDSLYRSPRSFLDAVHPEDRPRLDAAAEGLAEGRWDYEYRIVRPDGTLRWIHDRGFPVFDDGGNLVRMVGAATDITRRKQTEENLRKLSQAVQQSPVSVVITDLGGDIEYVNPKFAEVTGYAAEEVIGRNPRVLKSGFVAAEIYEELWQTIGAGNEWRGELLNRKKDGTLFWEFASISPIKTDDGRITHFVAVKEDITVRKEYEERLLHQASFDDLTGLPNRLLTLDRVDQAIARARRGHQSVAVAFIDLDDFKAINDTLGHSAGDALLVEAARRLTASVRAGDTVGRLGGDEFVIVLPDLSEGRQAEVVADKILAAFRQPFPREGGEATITTSIGISVFPADGDDAHALLRNADAAMYQAKAAGRNTGRFFTPQVNRQAVRRSDVEHHLRHALDRRELFVVYHPMFDLRHNRLVGAEALLRWENPDLGPVAPEYFVPVAENSGLIERLGEFVVRTACRESAAWPTVAEMPMRVAINVSSRQFRGDKLALLLENALEDNRLTPSRVEIEITERVLVDDSPQTIATLTALSAIGIRISVDDFGTGYSSISYLKRFPVSVLKIDRSFVRDITTSPSDAALAIAMIGMAHSLGIEVVAEGVETEEQLAFLRFHGCDLAQGDWFARPMSSEAFAEFVAVRGGRCLPTLRPAWQRA